MTFQRVMPGGRRCFGYVYVTFITMSVIVIVHKTILSHLFRFHQFLVEPESYEVPEDFEFFDNEIGLMHEKYIVPNVVHFIKWTDEISFIEAVCIWAAVVNQKPEKLYIHTDRTITGKYWRWVTAVPEVERVLELKYLPVPREIFDQDLSEQHRVAHGSDIGRLQVLLKYGGIYLHGETFLVQSLDEFRRYEMALGWEEGKFLDSQAIVAHKNARFLRKWLDSYRHHYWSTALCYNSIERPTRAILEKQPFLIHRMNHIRLQQNFNFGKFLYLQNDDSWRDHYVIHLSLKWWILDGKIGANLSSTATYPVIFDETNIKQYNCTLRQMVQSVIAHLQLGSNNERSGVVWNSNF